MKGVAMTNNDSHAGSAGSTGSTGSPSARAGEATRAHLAQFGDEDLAYHEAGHAVVHHLNGGTVARVSIERSDARRGVQLAPRQAAAQEAAARQTGETGESREALERKIGVLVAGEVAATLHGTPEHLVTAGGRVDHEQALRAAAEAGMEHKEARAMIDAAWERVREQLREPGNWRLVEALAQELLRRRTLDAEQVKAALAA
jgi:ATP-dependent Zn protease